MRPNYDDPIPPILGLEIGEVIDRDDPEGLGRVRIRIPGLIDRSNWAWPLGVSGGGSRDEGFFNVPPLHSEVGVLFKQGHPDHPYYMPANWGTGEPPEASSEGDPDVKVIALKDYDVIVDTRPASKSFKIVDKSSSRDVIEFNGITRALTLKATSGITIEATGEVRINGLQVIINGIPAGLGRL